MNLNNLNTGIYIITNTINSKCYVGSAVNIKKRWRNHKSDLNKNKHINSHLQAAWNKYGSEVFNFDILAFCNKEDLIYFEQKCMDLLKPEYNMCKTAGSPLGMKHSDEARAKMSAAGKGHKRNLGKKHSEETRVKMSEAQKLRYVKEKQLKHVA